MPSVSACRVDMMLRVIGDRWTLGIIHKLSLGPRRTIELHSSFTGLSTKTLADRLKKLERSGIVSRMSYPESPPRVEYSLTGKGRDLLRVIVAISDTASDWNMESAFTGAAKDCRACNSNTPRDEQVSQKERRSGSRAEKTTQVAKRKRDDVTLL